MIRRSYELNTESFGVQIADGGKEACFIPITSEVSQVNEGSTQY